MGVCVFFFRKEFSSFRLIRVNEVWVGELFFSLDLEMLLDLLGFYSTLFLAFVVVIERLLV